MTESPLSPPSSPPSSPAPAGGLVVRAVVRRGEFVLDIALGVGPGEIVAVLGPNGAGKSTLLGVLAGLTGLDEGAIVLGERVLDDVGADVFVPPERRPVGLVFQNYRLFPHLSVLDNVAFAARARGVRRAAARSIAGDWLARLELVELADRKPDQLSGGQGQRVALARALASEPGLLLLDEPTAALDARTRLTVRADLRRHLRQFSGPTVLVTHDPLEAMVMADRLVVIERGRVVQTGAPGEVARRPATQYVARLVGLNLYAGSVAAGSVAAGSGAAGSGAAGSGAGGSGAAGSRRVELDDGGVLSWPGDPAVSGPVWVALRPSSIAVHTSEPVDASPRNVWPGRVEGMELLTDRVRLAVDGVPAALVDVTADAVAELRIVEGSPVWLSAKATDVDVYPMTR